MCDDRSWALIAPWWAWPKLGQPARDVRGTRPVLQKYDGSDPVSLFVREPQKALAYGPEDVAQRVRSHPGQTPATRLSDYYLEPIGRRKLYLPTHQRFYLVICELHCDAPGLPSVDGEKVCEAGFVVRRKRLTYRAEHQPRARELVERASGIGAELARLERRGRRALRRRHAVTAGGVQGGMTAATASESRLEQAVELAAAAKRAQLVSQLAAVHAELKQWRDEAGAVSVAEAWVPTDAENVGDWQVLGDTPGATLEQVYPLYPLHADPRTEGHDARGKSLYFGLVPLVSRENDPTGSPRFDDRSRYEVRCFVRRHRCDCPKTGERNDCGGELVWSASTEEYEIAPALDPIGTGNHPITIQLPDIPALAATVGARLPVRMVSPPGSAMAFQVRDGKAEGGRLAAGQQICFVSIPLITIIATFVLNLFLPIVVFLFQLWFLLGLRFCIPPSISLGAGLNLHTGISGKLDAAVDAELDILLAADIGLAALGDSGLRDRAAPSGLGPEDLEPPEFRSPKPPAAELRDALSTDVLKTLRTATTADRTEEVESDSVLAGRTYVARVERWEVGA